MQRCLCLAPILALAVIEPALADDSSQAIADRVKASNVEIANNFSPAWGIECLPPPGRRPFRHPLPRRFLRCRALARHGEPRVPDL